MKIIGKIFSTVLGIALCAVGAAFCIIPWRKKDNED